MKHQSSYKINQNGVPQGTVLGPLEFLFYINEHPDVTDFKTILFADDSYLLFTMEPNTNISNYISRLYKLQFIIYIINN